MRELAVRFGKSAALSGVLTEPGNGAARADAPVLVLLNSGILHRVGSCRLHVQLARALAAAGFTSLRFDFSGIGDSEPRRDSLSFEASSQIEVGEALDYLQQTRGAPGFVLMGLCSGADMAHLASRSDPRVRGLVFIDGWAYTTPRFWLHYYGQRVFKAHVWKNWAAIRVRRLRGELSARRAPAQSTDEVMYDVPKYVRPYPPREIVAADLRAFMARGMQILAIFTAGLTDVYNHKAQYRSAFRDVEFGDRLQVEFIPHSDHIITDVSHQRLVVQRVREWFERAW